MNCLCMPAKEGFVHKRQGGVTWNIPHSAAGSLDCMTDCYPSCMIGAEKRGTPHTDKNQKRICAASCHNKCG